MTTRAEATAAPSEFKVKGKTYYLTPFADEAWGELEQWLQDRVFAIARRNLDGLDGQDRAALLRGALDKASRVRFCDLEAQDALETYDGAVKVVYLQLRPRHPKITEEEVSELLLDPGVLKVVMDMIALGFPSNPLVTGKKKRPARTAKRRKRKAARTAKKPNRR